MKNIRKEFYRKNKLNIVIIMLLEIVGCAYSLALSIFLQKIIDLATKSDKSTISTYVFIAIGAILFAIILYIIYSILFPKFVNRACRQYKEFIFDKIMKRDIKSFNDDGQAAYVSAFTNDMMVIEEKYIKTTFVLASKLMLLIGALIIMFFNHWLLSLIAIGTSLLPFVISIALGKTLSNNEKDLAIKNENFVYFMNDCLSGFSVIKSFKAENKISTLFKTQNERVEASKERKLKYVMILENMCMICGIAAQIIVFLVGALFCIQGKITTGTILLFVQLMNYVVQPLASVPQTLALRKASKPLIERASELVKIESTDNRSIIGTLNDGIILDNLSFSYGDKQVLNNISYKFEAKKSYAIVGTSGSGKTTLFNLLTGTYDNYEGSLRYDNNEIREINMDSLYDIISLIQQNVFVFDDTIENNITMYSSVNQEMIDSAIAKSGLSELIASKGSSYLCGDNGSNLSGGEKQRISIARGLIKNSRLLLVDEATSALDNETSTLVTHSILGIEDTTKIFITHKLEEKTLSCFDGILVMKNGVIAETGTYEELKNKGGLFASLLNVSE